MTTALLAPVRARMYDTRTRTHARKSLTSLEVKKIWADARPVQLDQPDTGFTFQIVAEISGFGSCLCRIFLGWEHSPYLRCHLEGRILRLVLVYPCLRVVNSLEGHHTTIADSD